MNPHSHLLKHLALADCFEQLAGQYAAKIAEICG
ncbi:hypothetical protein ACP_2395 [Acidobacterium capsulatum ATCC 51196]|uniref:Uncharacterized protein n=1 Tax=Acidobacterium capsulatum (strain ATCC 51196 / DSM 11244 / BCRC 80197 / JCM 7670 / NBRC 15755 / NCIMB 13165 / 161) TaxID=240015 RepID=C1F191_ACIC5|nr:hypothetical protein ACP_2395 [Acidobacterium capsulatum ATCC 51196]